jgi:ATP-dependent DNA helicase PIF1
MFRNNSLKIDPLINSNLQELLKEININIDVDENLSDTQKTAFELFKNGQNLLILGAGGCGKSHLIKIFKEYNDNLKKIMHVTSTTGISAYSIKGVTINSLFGIGTGEMEIGALIKKVYRKKMYRERIINTDILVIDEISMLSGELFEKLDIICQSIRRNKVFFGGIQIVFTGDLLQLLPVFNKNKSLYTDMDERLIIESPVFNKVFTKDNIIVLLENFRQKNDITFISLLNRIRNGTFTDDDINILNSRKINNESKIESIVHLVSSNKKAQLINESQLDKLKTPKVKYISTYTSSGKDKDIKELLMKELQFQFTQKGINELVLKKGCRVMLIKNLDVSRGLVNGALGTIKSFVQDQSTGQQNPVVLFDNNNKNCIEEIIPCVSWELEINNCKGVASQIPLMLAYSVTIHKSQSLSLDSAVLDLDDCWCDAQVYVALSRLCSLNGLYLKSFNPAKIKINKKMKDYLNNLEL